MYLKSLKENGSQLSVLIVDEICEYRDLLNEKLSKYFKKIFYASSSEEALSLHKNERFNIVLIDIDKETIDGLDLITQIQTIDANQSIFVYSDHIENSSLLIKLLNLGVSCFINKSEELEDYYKVFSKVCKQLCEQKMLIYYVAELEKSNYEFISSSKIIEEDDFEFFPTPSKEEDDFEFFPMPAVQTSVPTEQDSLYNDYFNLLDADDREDLHDLLIDIDTTLINAFMDTGADSTAIAKLGALLIRYGNVLMHYQFFSDMGTAILEFGKVISDESEKVAIQEATFHSLISGFCSGLQGFMIEVWGKNSDNPKFFNDSIINDAVVIKEMIIPPAVVDNDDDLVFF